MALSAAARRLRGKPCRRAGHNLPPPVPRAHSEHVDFLSVQATMIGEATSFRQRMTNHIMFYANNKKG